MNNYLRTFLVLMMVSVIVYNGVSIYKSQYKLGYIDAQLIVLKSQKLTAREAVACDIVLEEHYQKNIRE